MKSKLIIILLSLLYYSTCAQVIPCPPQVCLPITAKIIRSNSIDFPLKEIQSGSTKINADRINLIVIGKGYNTADEFLTTARRDIAFEGDNVFDADSFDKVLFGLFAVEP